MTSNITPNNTKREQPMNAANKNDILGLIDYLNDADLETLALYDDAPEWHARCIAWITKKLEQETTK